MNEETCLTDSIEYPQKGGIISVMSEEEEIQDSVEHIWDLLNKVKELDNSNTESITKIYWRQNQDKHWDFIKISQFGSTFHKTYGKVGGQFKISGYEFRDNKLAYHHWYKQNKKIDNTYKKEWEFSKIAGKVFSDNYDDTSFLNKLLSITTCFQTSIINEGFANFDKELIEDFGYMIDVPRDGYDFHLWTCDKNLFVQRLTELNKLLPVGLKIYNTYDFEKYAKRYKKEPIILFEK